MFIDISLPIYDQPSMTKKLKIVFTLILLLSFGSKTFAQTSSIEPVTVEEVALLVERIADSLAYYYVDAEVGKQIGVTLKKQHQSGAYNNITAPEKLALRLKEDLQSISGDKHLFVSFTNEHAAVSEAADTDLTEPYGRDTNYGFQELRFLGGNVGYLKISHFSNWNHASEARQKATEMMAALGGSDALIFDVRDNKGGVPYLVSYLVSYLFDDDPVHLTDFYVRFNDSGHSMYTEPLIPGARYPDVPVFILVNKNTASAGEELAFWLKNLGRATVVGENTAGAGFGAMSHRLNERFTVSISSEVEIDPASSQGFEKIGVTPNVAADSEAAFAVTVELATAAAIDFRKGHQDRIELEVAALHRLLELPTESVSQNEITAQVITCSKSGGLTSTEINALGYQYINQPKKAIAILKANTILYPFFPDPFDSYADALAAGKEYHEAMLNYEKAVELAALKQNNNLSLYTENRDAFKRRYESIQAEKDAIEQVLLDYIDGTALGAPLRIQRAFHPDLNLYSIENDSLRVTSGQAYISFFKPGVKASRVGRITSIDFVNDAATATIEVAMPGRGRLYTDYLLLLKINKTWKIIHKSYTFVRVVD